MHAASWEPAKWVLRISCPSALHGWLHMLLRRGLPRFTAYNWLPLHRCRLSKYDSLILMRRGKHSPNTDAALHAWSNSCRCCLIISPTCILSWSVNSRTIPIIAVLARPPVHQRFDWLQWRQRPPPGPVPSQRLTLCLQKDKTCPILNGNFHLGGCLVSDVRRCLNKVM